MKLRYKLPFFNWLAQLFQKVSGIPPLTMPRAVAGGLKEVTAYGGCALNGIPSEYTEVTYVSNAANTLVKTGVVIGNDDTFQIDIKASAVTDSFYLFQSRDEIYSQDTLSSPITGISGTAMGLTVQGIPGQTSASLVSSISRTAGHQLRIVFTCMNELASLYVKDFNTDAEDTVSGPYDVSQLDRGHTEMCLYGNDATPVETSITPNRLGSGCEIYYAKLWKNGLLVLDLVPVTRNADNAAGFYNRVNGTFLMASEGSLTAGTAVTPSPDNPVDIWCNNGKLIPNSVGSSTQDGTPSPDNPVEIQNYTQGNIVLRGVGICRDIYNAPTDTITRNVGIKIFDGSETEFLTSSAPPCYSYPKTALDTNSTVLPPMTGADLLLCTHYPCSNSSVGEVCWSGFSDINFNSISRFETLDDFKQFLAQQYQNGTPVTLYYPLATETWNDVVYAEGTQETVKLTTRNLFNVADLRNKSVAGVSLTVADDGWITINGETTLPYYSELIYTLSNPLPEGTYTLSLNNDKTISSTSALVGLLVDGLVSDRRATFRTLDNYKTLTIPSGSICNKITFRITSVNNMKVRLQIEKGDTRTSYVSFNDCRANAEYLLKVAFYGRVYKDEQNIINGSLIRKCKIKIFNGGETFTLLAEGGIVNIYRTTLSDCEKSFSSSEGSTIICSHIISRKSNTIPWSCYIFNRNFFITLPADIFQTAQDVNNWFTAQHNAGTPVIVVYPLETPVTEQVASQALNTVAGTNTLEITQASLPGLELAAEYKRH